MCEQHKDQTAKKQFDRNRPSSYKRGYDGSWERVRVLAMVRDSYACVWHRKHGVMLRATDVDHIIPFDGLDDPLRLDLDNLQSLCKACHSRKTATEDSSFASRGI